MFDFFHFCTVTCSEWNGCNAPLCCLTLFPVSSINFAGTQITEQLKKWPLYSICSYLLKGGNFPLSTALDVTLTKENTPLGRKCFLMETGSPSRYSILLPTVQKWLGSWGKIPSKHMRSNWRVLHGIWSHNLELGSSKPQPLHFYLKEIWKDNAKHDNWFF